MFLNNRKIIDAPGAYSLDLQYAIFVSVDMNVLGLMRFQVYPFDTYVINGKNQMGGMKIKIKEEAFVERSYCHKCCNGVVELGEECDEGANNGSGKPCSIKCEINSNGIPIPNSTKKNDCYSDYYGNLACV